MVLDVAGQCCVRRSAAERGHVAVATRGALSLRPRPIRRGARAVRRYPARVLIPIERLLLRTRHVRTRADELIALHARLRAARSERPGTEEYATAVELRTLKGRVSGHLAAATSCASCAVGKRWPRGAFAGGDCCTGVTADLFGDDEVAALAEAGTRVGDLRAPTSEHAGCAFRGEVGWVLDGVEGVYWLGEGGTVRVIKHVSELCRRLRGS